jgi:ParB-like chromosome segregation protein Spo0J
MKVEKRKVKDLRFYPGNPRKMSVEEYEKLKQSILRFGLVDPLVINPQNEVIGGNQRLKVLRELGWDEVDVVVVDLPKEKEKALNIALNKIKGEFDEDLLKVFALDLEPADIELLDLGETDFEEIEFKERELKPYKKVHILISVPVDEYEEISEDLKRIREKIHEGEYEQSAN